MHGLKRYRPRIGDPLQPILETLLATSETLPAKRTRDRICGGFWLRPCFVCRAHSGSMERGGESPPFAPYHSAIVSPSLSFEGRNDGDVERGLTSGRHLPDCVVVVSDAGLRDGFSKVEPHVRPTTSKTCRTSRPLRPTTLSSLDQTAS